jgi:hypothetical protein
MLGPTFQKELKIKTKHHIAIHHSNNTMIMMLATTLIAKQQHSRNTRLLLAGSINSQYGRSR